MLIGKRWLAAVEFHVKMGVIVDVEGVLLDEEECVETAVADICRSPLVVEVNRRIYQTDYLELLHVELFAFALAVLLGDLDAVAYAESRIGDAVGVYHAFVDVLGQSALRDVQHIDVFRHRYGLERLRIPVARACHDVYLDGAFGFAHSVPGLGKLHAVVICSVRR